MVSLTQLRMTARSVALILLLSALPPVGSTIAQETEGAKVNEQYPLRDVPLDTYQLESWGTRRYYMFGFMVRKREEKDVIITERIPFRLGAIQLKTDIEDDVVKFTDTWADPAGERGWAYLKYECNRDNLLSTRKLTHQQGQLISVCDVTDGDFELKQYDRTRSGKWPADTVTEASLLRIFTLLPREPGIAYRLKHYTTTPEINVVNVEDEPIICHGTETLTLRNLDMECTRYTFRNMTAWVRNVDNTLVRFVVPGWRILELVERPAEYAAVLKAAEGEE